MDPKVAEDLTCHFLNAPPEVRLNIYRYLLLDPPRASLDRSYPDKEINAMMDQEHMTHAIVESVKALDDHKYLWAHAAGEGTVMYNHLIPDQPPAPWEPVSPPPATDAGEDPLAKRFAERKCKFEHEYKIQRYPVVLRLNRQIYKEASALLYSSLVIDVRPSDVIPSSDFWDDIVEPIDNVWRLNMDQLLLVDDPIQQREHIGAVFGRIMAPHDFTKLERISFNVTLCFIGRDEDAMWPTFTLDDNFRTEREDEETFVTCLKGRDADHPPVSDIFLHFANFLVRSPYISHLNVSLAAKVDVAFEIGSDDEDEEESEQLDQQEEKMINVADQRAIELVMEAGVLDPLKQLSNVKSLGLSFTSPECGDIAIKPKSKLEKMVWELRKLIEGKFAARSEAI